MIPTPSFFFQLILGYLEFVGVLSLVDVSFPYLLPARDRQTDVYRLFYLHYTCWYVLLDTTSVNMYYSIVIMSSQGRRGLLW